MANKPLKSIKYPGLSDTYTFLQNDPTLTQSGQAADAKVVGDEIATKVSKPTSSPNGTAGQLLRTNGDGTTQWVDQGLPTDEQTAEAIDEWLTDHPEATTTVQDGAVTEPKLAPALKPKVLKDYVTPEMFGAVGDGIADDTSALQDAIDYASTNKCGVYLSKKYKVTTIIIKNGVTSFNCDGTLIGSGGDVAVIAFEGYTYGENAVEDCNVNANIDMSAGNTYGIRGMGIKRCTIHDCNIFGITDSSTFSRIAISLEKDANYNSILNNNIIGYENPNKTPAHIGIRIMGDSAEWGGFYTDNIVDPILPAKHNVVENNHIIFGETAIDILGAEYCNIQNNNCLKQSTRSIYVANATHHCTISNNIIIGFAASAVLLGYCCYKNIIANNVIKQISEYNGYGGEAAINIFCGCEDNEIVGNLIESFTNYGVYLAINSIGNIVNGNSIKGYYLAAIALESDWIRPLPANDFIYSRPNYGEPAEGEHWASKDTEKNVIINNTIYDGYEGRDTCAIYVSQLGTVAKTIYNIVKNNNIVMDQLTNSWSIWFTENTTDYMIHNVLEGNKVKNVNVFRQFLKRGKLHFDSCRDNDGIDTASMTVNSGSVVSVGKGVFFNLNYSTQTTVTNFIEGIDEQEIIVKLGGNVLLAYGGGTIVLKDKTNVQGDATMWKTITFKRLLGVWVEISRNF